MTTLTEKKIIKEKQISDLFYGFYETSGNLESFVINNIDKLDEEVLNKARQLSVEFKKDSEKYGKTKYAVGVGNNNNYGYYKTLYDLEKRVSNLVTTCFHAIKHNSVSWSIYEHLLGEIEDIERQISLTITKWNNFNSYLILGMIKC